MQIAKQMTERTWTANYILSKLTPPPIHHSLVSRRPSGKLILINNLTREACEKPKCNHTRPFIRAFVSALILLIFPNRLRGGELTSWRSNFQSKGNQKLKFLKNRFYWLPFRKSTVDFGATRFYLIQFDIYFKIF